MRAIGQDCRAERYSFDACALTCAISIGKYFCIVECLEAAKVPLLPSSKLDRRALVQMLSEAREFRFSSFDTAITDRKISACAFP